MRKEWALIPIGKLKISQDRDDNRESNSAKKAGAKSIQLCKARTFFLLVFYEIGVTVLAPDRALCDLFLTVRAASRFLRQRHISR